VTGAEPGTRSVDAPGKVNAFLRVLGRREDGYHDLQTLLVPISIADRVEVHAEADRSFRTLSLSLEVTGDPDAILGVPRDESNLVLRAAAALGERAGVRGFADVSLHKVVPVAAGLGGGSADAAAVLGVLNELWECGLGPEALRDVGASVGSDVPALLMGGAVLATGRGERVGPVRLPPLSLVLVTFPFPVSTPDAFGWWDLEGSTGPDLGPLLDAAFTGDGSSLAASLFNDLEDPVSHRHPEIAEAKRILVEGGAVGAVMSGSGPTVVGVMAAASSRLTPEAESLLANVSGMSPRYVSTIDGPGDPQVLPRGWDSRG
jgi:4-diphosphocytidyl-2-C-methyl-D-erythritol kinase